jgi:hypothetical protein
MKRCRWAAVLLCGWYLLTPPFIWSTKELVKPLGQRIAKIAADRPYSEWQIEKTFDSASACEGARKWYRDNGEAYPVSNTWVYAECIASDDPRLKEHQP